MTPAHGAWRFQELRKISLDGITKRDYDIDASGNFPEIVCPRRRKVMMKAKKTASGFCSLL